MIGNRDRHRLARRELGDTRRDAEMIFRVVEPALPFGRVLEVTVPHVLRCDGAAIGADPDRRGTGERHDANAAGRRIDLHRPAARVRRSVQVAMVRERAQRQLQRRACAHGAIAHVGPVRVVLHPDAPLQQGVAADEAPDRHRPLEPETGEVDVALRRDRPVAPTIGGECVGRAVVRDLRVDLRAQQRSSDRRGARREQQSVIAPRQRAGDRPRREAAESVGDDPFATFGDREIAAERAVELKAGHRAPPTPCARASAALRRRSGGCAWRRRGRARSSRARCAR